MKTRSLVSLVALAACGSGGEEVTISGRAVVMSSQQAHAAPGQTRTISHVMAVDPSTAAPRRTLARVGDDGSFELNLDVGRPYVLVFVDDTAVGADMAVAMFRASTLETLSPQLAGHIDLGDTRVDPETQEAAVGLGYDELITALGLSASAAEYLGAVDDLSLRYANPDIDGDGVIDVTQGRDFALDFHVRATMRAGGERITIDDMTDTFLDTSGPSVATPVFDLASIYVLYPNSFDGTVYVPQQPNAGLAHGAQYRATHADGSAVAANTSFSGVTYGDMRMWGPDYDLDHGSELPGSGGAPATLAYTLGSTETTLTFTNVVTRTRASLTEDGSLAIFLRLQTQAGAFTAIDYRWMKRASASEWIDATAEEIALTISSDGGHVSFHRAPSWHDEFGDTIPAQPSGSLPWSHTATGPGDVCGIAVSFDDKLGMRHFVGGADPRPGVTCAQ